jgi:hypothetical protein
LKSVGLRCGAALSAMVLLVAACSSGDDNATATTLAATAPPSTAPASTEPVTTEAATTEVSTTVTTTTLAATTTTDPTKAIIESYAKAFSANNLAAALALTAPGSPAYVYTESVGLLTDHGTQQYPPVTYTTTADGFQISDGTRYGGFVIENGLITNFTRKGTPLSESVGSIDQTFTAGAVTGLVHSARNFDGALQIVMMTTNGATYEGHIYTANYVGPDGRQLDVSLPGVNTVQPGATVAYFDTYNGAALGGTAHGQVGGIGGEINEFQVAVPA